MSYYNTSYNTTDTQFAQHQKPNNDDAEDVKKVFNVEKRVGPRAAVRIVQFALRCGQKRCG